MNQLVEVWTTFVSTYNPKILDDPVNASTIYLGLFHVLYLVHPFLSTPASGVAGKSQVKVF